MAFWCGVTLLVLAVVRTPEISRISEVELFSLFYYPAPPREVESFVVLSIMRLFDVCLVVGFCEPPCMTGFWGSAIWTRSSFSNSSASYSLSPSPWESLVPIGAPCAAARTLCWRLTAFAFFGVGETLELEICWTNCVLALVCCARDPITSPGPFFANYAAAAFLRLLPSPWMLRGWFSNSRAACS